MRFDVEEEIITMSDIRDAGFCASGLREFCAKNEVDMRRLVREGIPASEVEHIQDANLRHVLNVKRGIE
jgi:hypothetical protein